jgi:hypothetical protein
VCTYLTGPEGQAMGPAPKRSIRSTGLLFVVVAVLAIIGLVMAYPQIADL